MSAQQRHPEPVDRLLDLAVFAPLGLALAVREDLGGFADRGRTALTNRVFVARFVATMAFQRGRRELERRIGEHLRPSAPAATPTAPDNPADSSAAARTDADSSAAPSEPAAASEQPPARRRTVAGTSARTVAGTTAGTSARTAAGSGAGSSADLPIADYESLPAINVVQRLASLRPEEIEAVRRFEAAHRARRTVLAKIAQLQGG